MNNTLMWTYFIQLGSNMWNEPGITRGREKRSTPCASDRFLFDRGAWDEHTALLREVGVNTLVIDIGEAMRYESHPEIAIPGAWDHDTMRAEVERLQGMGFELIPKLNFSACHDVWLGEYSRMLSTTPYYNACRDIIGEVCEVFKPRHFHLGMDEENVANQVRLDYCVIRQHDLWWQDLYFLIDCVEKNGARPWVWSDYGWDNEEAFFEKMPKDVVQNNWYYSAEFDPQKLNDTAKARLNFFDKLSERGYDQMPTGSVFSKVENFEGLVRYSAEHIDRAHLLGFMQSAWERTDPDWMPIHRTAAETIKSAKAWYEAK